MVSKDQLVDSFITASQRSQTSDKPYRHWFLSHCLPEQTIADVLALPFAAPELGGISGKRELHNNTRTYFDAANQQAFPAVKTVADAFQDERMTRHVASFFGTDIDKSYLRIEYAQDVDGFWLEPHTDLGVKLFTLLVYVSTDPSHADLGTDIYDTDKRHLGRSPFASNAAMVFVPSGITYHGFEQRPIQGVRKSMIINYVTEEWRAREQLAFPSQPIHV